MVELSKAEVKQRADDLRQLHAPYIADRTRIRAIMDGGPEGVRQLLGDSIDIGDEIDIPAAHLMFSGIERLAQKLSQIPDVRVPVPDSVDSKRSKDTKAKLARIVEGYDEVGTLELQMLQQSRWLPGYGFGVWVIRELEINRQRYPVTKIHNPYNCVDEDTEILTKRGWLQHDELTTDDTVAGYNMESGLAQWTECLAVHRYDHDQELVAVDQRDLSMRLTENHRAIVQKRTGLSQKPGPIHLVEASDLTHQHLIPRSAPWVDSGEKSIGLELAALVGWVAAEGHFRDDLVYLSQSQSANPDKVAAIDALLAKVPLFTAYTGGRKNVHRSLSTLKRTERRRNGGTEVEWRFPLGLGQEFHRLIPGKLLGTWCYELPPDEREALLDAFIDGDGSRRGPGRANIFQKERTNLDVLQTLAVMSGYKTSLRRFKADPDGGHKWILFLTTGGLKSLRSRNRNRPSIRRTHYKGTVWCPTTGTGTFIARREGFVFITGNSYPGHWGVDQRPSELAMIRRVPGRTLKRVYGDRFTGTDDMASLSTFNIGELGKVWESPGSASGFNVIDYFDISGTYTYVEETDDLLSFVPNKLGIPRFVVPHRPSFNALVGQFSHLLGIMAMYAKLNVLAAVAMEDAVEVETNIFGILRGNEYQKGRHATNEFEVNARVEKPTTNMPYQLFEQIDRLERQLRLTSGYPITDDAESPNAFVTGRGLEELGAGSSRIVNEYQTIFKHALQDLDELRLIWDEEFYGTQTKNIYGMDAGTPYAEKYTPATDIAGQHRTKRVFGMMAGFDDPTFIVTALQLLDGGVVDVETVQENMRGLDNVPRINERIRKRGVEGQLVAGLGQQFAQGDQRAALTLAEMYDSPGDFEDILKKFFTPEDPQMSPEEEQLVGAAAGPGGGGPIPDVTTTLSRLTQSGQAEGGVQTVRTTRNEPRR